MPDTLIKYMCLYVCTIPGLPTTVLYYLCHGVGAAPHSRRRAESWACASSLCAHLAHAPSHAQPPCREALPFEKTSVKAGLGVWTVFPSSEFDGCC